jgi:hypothetical protein
MDHLTHFHQRAEGRVDLLRPNFPTVTAHF